MPKSAVRNSNPAPGAYRPHVAARRPGRPPTVRPKFRVLVHHKYLAVWNELADRVGLANAQQFWDHVAMTPGQPPKVGTASVMKGKHNAPKWRGYAHMATRTASSRSCPSTSVATETVAGVTAVRKRRPEPY
jgi:hypothetical protein